MKKRKNSSLPFEVNKNDPNQKILIKKTPAYDKKLREENKIKYPKKKVTKMKSLDKINRLTNNPLTLLAGINHFYLNKVFVGGFRAFVSFNATIISLMGIANQGYWIPPLFMGTIWAIYFVIDKNRIEEHLDNYNSKFSEMLELLYQKQFFKAFKKMVKFGAKDATIWIMENEPEALSGSLLGHVKKEEFVVITKQIERKDVDGILTSFRRLAIGF